MSCPIPPEGKVTVTDRATVVLETPARSFELLPLEAQSLARAASEFTSVRSHEELSDTLSVRLGKAARQARQQPLTPPSPGRHKAWSASTPTYILADGELIMHFPPHKYFEALEVVRHLRATSPKRILVQTTAP